MNVAHLHRLRKSGGLRLLFSDHINERKPKKIVVDYSSPNIAKQFHIGNLRSTLIGRYVEKVRPSDVFWHSCSDVDKIRTLTDCYVVANKKAKADDNFREEVRKTLENMEKEIVSGNTSSQAMQLWKDIRDISQRHLKQFYDLFNIEFDRWMFESSHVQYANELVDKLIRDGVARQTASGLWVIDLNGGEMEEYTIIRKSDTTTLYLSRELASIMARENLFNADRYLYVVDRAQRKHFEALKTILKRIGKEDLATKVEHVPYGRVKGLSTRSGRTEAVGDIINRGSELALEFMRDSKTFKVDMNDENEISKTLSISTVIFNDLKRAKSSEYEFSFKNAFAINQNNALFLQMKHSRLCSIESRNAELMPLLDSCQTFSEESPEVIQLMQKLMAVNQIIMESVEKLEPCRLTVYLVELAQSVGTVASLLKIKDQPREMLKIKPRPVFDIRDKSPILDSSDSDDDSSNKEVIPVPTNFRVRKDVDQKELEKTKGKDWFDMPATELTEEAKRDLELLQMRSALDPLTRYRRNDRTVLPKYFQIGRVVDAPEDYYSSRMTKKERKKTMVDELLHDMDFQKKSKERGDMPAEETLEVTPVSFRKLFRFASLGDILCILLGTMFAVFGGAIQPMVLILGGLITSVYLQPIEKIGNDKFWFDVMHLIKWLGITGFMSFFTTYLQSYLLHRGCMNIVHTLREEFMRAILRQDSTWFDLTHSGAVTTQLNEYVNYLL
uniref:Probable arginine--tRNA ligase, mitochondrial n=1 Tax=Heterorhabditis bacteriophora TaxID=37862 RepID=A0A1I7XC66_HETBA